MARSMLSERQMERINRFGEVSRIADEITKDLSGKSRMAARAAVVGKLLKGEEVGGFRVESGRGKN